MAKLPSSFRQRNRTARGFRDQYAKLPKAIQELTRDACRKFDADSVHPSFRRHELDDRRGASHQPGSISISITMQYRAIFVKVGGINVWYWIGTHAEYKRFTAR